MSWRGVNRDDEEEGADRTTPRHGEAKIVEEERVCGVCVGDIYVQKSLHASNGFLSQSTILQDFVQDLSSRSEILHKILHEILHERLVTGLRDLDCT